MIKSFLFLLALIYSVSLFAQDYKVTVDEDNEEPLILGYCPLSILSDSLFDNTWTTEYNNYTPDFEILDKLEGKLDSINITIVFRSTCSDSREQLPRFFKILNELNYNLNRITLIGVNREKHGLSNEADGLDIQFVPTIIFYKDGNEIGRIVETPYENMEKDLSMFVLK